MPDDEPSTEGPGESPAPEWRGVSSCSQVKPTSPKGCWNFWDGRDLKGPLGSKTPGGGDPNTSLLL